MAMTNEVKLGKPKYEQNNRNYFSFGKDKNAFILRILPPMFELADAGKWSAYHRVEFGHVGTDNRMKPFLSPRVVNYEKMVEVESDSHVRREKVKLQEAQAKEEGNKAVQEQCKAFLSKYNQDAKHYMNVVDLQGNVGLFKIGHNGMKALKKEIDRLRSEGCDPIGIENGRYFVFSRSGKGRDTLYTCVEYKQKREVDDGVGGKILADVPFPHNIDSVILNKLSTDAFELTKVYPKITAAEETRIINEGATAVDEILGKKQETAKSNPASQAPTGGAETPVTTAVLTSNPPQTPVAGVLPGTPVDTTSAVVAQAASPIETVATETSTTTVDTGTGEIIKETPVAETTTPAVETTTNTIASVADMNETDFFKMVEDGKF
jgi:hypothetical protein